MIFPFIRLEFLDKQFWISQDSGEIVNLKLTCFRIPTGIRYIKSEESFSFLVLNLFLWF